MIPVLTNGEVTSIASQGFAEDYRNSETDTQQKLAAPMPCYVTQEEVTSYDSRGVNLETVTEVLIDSSFEDLQGPPQAGDNITFSVGGGTAQTNKIRDVERITWGDITVNFRLKLEN